MVARPPSGPGLTVVTGRNGSGTSSFAEAAELALTGVSSRGNDKQSNKPLWRNLHAAGQSEITVGLVCALLAAVAVTAPP